MAFTMTKDIETGNAQIDKEHVELFAKINDFMEACNKGNGTDEIMKTVLFLEKYTITHFGNEERLQQKNNYPHYDAHKAFHVQFMANLKSIMNEIETKGVSSSLIGKINIQIGSALLAHIKTEDVKLANYLKANAVTS